jgi:flagellar hook-length control protein FliK
LLRDLATKRSSEATQQRCITELEKANAELRTELEQSNIKVQELELSTESLTVGYRQLSEKYKKLGDYAEAWQQEKAEVKKSCQARVDKVEGEFQRYHVHFR